MTIFNKLSKHSNSFYSLLFLIILEVLLPKNYSIIFTFIPIRLFLLAIFLLIVIFDVFTHKIELNCIKLNIVVYTYIVFLLFALPSILVSMNRIISIYTLVKFALFLLVFVAAIKIKFTSLEYKTIFIVFIVLILLLALYGFFEYYLDSSIFKIGIERYEGARGRISSSFFNTIYYGIFINLIFVFLLSFYFKIKKPIYIVMVGILLLMVYCNMIFTFTRSSFMVFWGTFFLLIFLYKNLLFSKKVIVIVFLMISLTFMIPGSVNFVTTSFVSTTSITSKFKDILNIVPNFLNFGTKKIAVASIDIENTSYEIKVKGQKISINAIVMPGNATNKKIVWSSGDSNIATVDENGNVTAINNGVTTISVKNEDYKKIATTKVTVNYPVIQVNGIQVDKNQVLLNSYGKTDTITATIIPEDAFDRKVTWSSSNSNVVKVDLNGKVTAINNGTATITVTTNNGNKTASILVNVNFTVVSVTDIVLNNTNILLDGFGKSVTLTATVSPKNATKNRIIWESSDNDIASVTENGEVTAINNGVATITATTIDGNKKATAIIHVKYDVIPVTGISISDSFVTLKNIGETFSINTIILPVNAINSKITWISSNEKIVSVDSTGKIKAMKNGTVNITATTVDGGFQAIIKVTVKVNIPIPDYSLINRNEFAKIGNRIGNDHFLTGVGFGTYIDYMNSENFKVNYPDYSLTHTHPHSSIILIFAENGALSLLSFVLFMLSVLFISFVNFLKYKNSSTNAAIISRILPVIIIDFMLVCSIAENAVYDTQIFTLFLLIVGLSLGYCEIFKKETKVVFISSAGGHLTEMLHLKELFNKFSYVVITEKTDTTLKLKQQYKNVLYLHYATRINKISFVINVLYNSVLSIFYFFKVSPSVIISTGANTAVPICLLGKLFGSKVIFIETVANAKTGSVSGKILYPFVDLFVVQWESLLVIYPKAVYWGWIF